MKVIWEKFEPFGPTGEVKVWLDVEKADEAWKSDFSFYIGSGGAGNAIGDRYEKVGKHLSIARKLWMPFVTTENGVLTFGDGRHRFSWLRDHGAKAIAAMVPPDQANAIRRTLGTSLRLTEYFL